jgi:hypothetical protein
MVIAAFVQKIYDRKERAMPENNAEIEALRKKVIDCLTDSFSQDLLTMEEYETKVSAANKLDNPEELRQLINNLPVLVRPNAPEARVKTNALLKGQAAQSSSCIMGNRRLQGRWLTSDSVNTFCVMGETIIDLRDTDLPPGALKIDIFQVMGETKIIVPKDYPVTMNAFSFMAEARADRDVSQQIHGAVSWLEISGFVVMGSIRVQVGE